ncbi:MAG: isoprenylcysteine carboxylmethyltransferase family protein [Mycobacterium sp.]|nr:isoprenylcysteine carboxylmethyltransferase family protein [Mycobacterium sp.]
MATESRAERRWLLAGYGGLAGFFALEALTRKPGAASSLAASPDDRGTTRMIVTAYVVAAEAPLALRRVPLHQLPQLAGPVGMALQASGLALRTWSMRTLGTSYTRTLRTDDQQHVVDTGPYRFVRHPGYAGSLLTWTGFALASRSIPVVLLVAALLGRAYRQRIVTEENLLKRELPGYSEYIHRTKRIVPFVW